MKNWYADIERQKKLASSIIEIQIEKIITISQRGKSINCFFSLLKEKIINYEDYRIIFFGLRINPSEWELISFLNSCNIKFCFFTEDYNWIDFENSSALNLFNILSEKKEYNKSVIAKSILKKRISGYTHGSNGYKLAKLNKEKSISFMLKIKPIIQNIKESGCTTIKEISEQLNKQKIPTYTSKGKWHPTTVQNILKKIEDNNV